MPKKVTMTENGKTSTVAGNLSEQNAIALADGLLRFNAKDGYEEREARRSLSIRNSATVNGKRITIADDET